MNLNFDCWTIYLQVFFDFEVVMVEKDCFQKDVRGWVVDGDIWHIYLVETEEEEIKIHALLHEFWHLMQMRNGSLWRKKKEKASSWAQGYASVNKAEEEAEAFAGLVFGKFRSSYWRKETDFLFWINRMRIELYVEYKIQIEFKNVQLIDIFA